MNESAQVASERQLRGPNGTRASDFPFAIAVADVYEGPLDLLLDLIRKQDIDIYHIPIAQITAQYLHYIERMKQLDAEMAAEFVYMASLLIHIKSRMLLPRDPADASDEEDPRTELVNRLLEHERFRNAAQMLLQKQQIEEAVWSNPALKEFREDENAERELAADVVDLVKTFRSVLDRLKNRPVIEFNQETVTVGQMIDFVCRRLMLEERPVRLKQLLRNLHSRQALICMFLALLELIRLQAIMARQDHTFGEIIIKKHTHFDAIATDAAAIRDDWK
ncbi:MAG: segregation/condensation protein A [Acidobacteria bacterium]|nr:segregation/condensation protein A [Acidobacteriota bacterium]